MFVAMVAGNEIEIETMAPPDTNKVEMMESKGNKMMDANVVMTQPGILAGKSTPPSHPLQVAEVQELPGLTYKRLCFSFYVGLSVKKLHL